KVDAWYNRVSFPTEVWAMGGHTLLLSLLVFAGAVVPLTGQESADKPPAGGRATLETRKPEEDHDEVVARFIRYEIGLNCAALENYSCPYRVFSTKLHALVSVTDDVTLIGYGVEHIGEGATKTTHHAELEVLRGEYQRRLVAIVQGRLENRDL